MQHRGDCGGGEATEVGKGQSIGGRRGEDLRVMAQSGSCKCNEKAWGDFGLEGGHLT